MINNYCLYYLYKSNDSTSDVLMIYFGGNKQPIQKAVVGKIEVLINEKPIAYVINEFSKLCKVKINGTIFLPNDALIHLINSELANANLDTLSIKDESGYVVGKVVSIEESKQGNLITVDIGTEKFKTVSTFDLKLNDLVVYAKNNTYLFPGQMINSYEFKGNKCDGRICSFTDLQMNSDNDGAVILDDGCLGEDFFKMEVKVNA